MRELDIKAFGISPKLHCNRFEQNLIKRPADTLSEILFECSRLRTMNETQHHRKAIASYHLRKAHYPKYRCQRKRRRWIGQEVPVDENATDLLAGQPLRGRQQ